jgi:hypothetical protein
MIYKVRLMRVQHSDVTVEIEARSKEHAEQIAASAVNCLQNGMIVEVYGEGGLNWQPSEWTHTYEVLPRL